MQHKSLFAALLCGALCLTACLKNEESPSVTLVRESYAEKLQGEANKLNAEAEATLILAKAEATLKEAQAKLQEANIKLVEAQAEKEKAEAAKLLAEADLQKAQAELARADVDLKKQELARRVEELKAQVAEYEARIAEAEANKLYWENQKKLLEKQLEIALVNAEKDLLIAKAQLIQAQQLLEQTLAAYEEYQTDVREDVRQRVEDTWDAYYTAAAALIELEHTIIDEEFAVAAAEAGLISETELKDKLVALNNREIDRIQNVIDYIGTLATADPEDIKDQLVEKDKEVYEQLQKVLAAEEARDAVRDQIWFDAANASGLDADDPDYNITYAYTQEFFAPETGELDIQYLPYAGYYDEVDWDALEYVAYKSGYTDYEYDEDGLFHRSFVTYTYDYATGEETEEPIELYSYYYNGYDPIGMKTTPERYPALEEGVVYESYEHNPFTVIDNYEFFPLEINRDGYKAYVDFKNALAENERKLELYFLNWDYDDLEVAIQGYIDRFQAFLDVNSSTFEKMGKKIDDTIEGFLSDYNDVLDDYQAYYDAYNDYLAKYLVENSVERTEALQAYQAAMAAWTSLLTASEYLDLQNAASDATTARKQVENDIASAEKAKKDFEDSKTELTGDYITWQTNIGNLKHDLGVALADQKTAGEDLTATETAYNTAKTAYETAKAKAATSLEAFYAAYQAYKDAEKAWLAAGSPDPSALKTTMDNANNAVYDYPTGAFWVMLTDQSDLSTKESTYNTAAANYEAAKTAKDTADKKVADLQEKLDKELAYYPDSFDEKIAAEKAKLPAAQEAETNALKALQDYEDKITEADKAREDAYKAWKAVAGDDTEWAAVEALYTDFVASANKLYETDPINQLFRDYGVITDLDYGSTDEWVWVYDFYSYGVDESEANVFVSNAPTYFINPNFDIEEFVMDALCAALNSYFNYYAPSIAFYNYFAWQEGTLEYEYLYNNFSAEDISDYLYYDNDSNVIVEWDIDPEDYDSWAWMSPLGIFFICWQLTGELPYISANWPNSNWPQTWYESSFTDSYGYTHKFLTIPYCEDLLAQAAEYRERDIEICNKYWDDQIEENNAYLDRVDEILAFEATYKSAIDDLNALAQQLPALEIALWEEEVKLDEVAAEAEALYYAQKDAQALLDIIAALEEEIADLEETNANLEAAIVEQGHVLNIAKAMLELHKAEYEVKKALVDDLKAEFDAAFAALQAQTAGE